MGFSKFLLILNSGAEGLPKSCAFKDVCLKPDAYVLFLTQLYKPVAVVRILIIFNNKNSRVSYHGITDEGSEKQSGQPL